MKPKIPPKYKISKTPKRLLVKSLGNKLPEEIVYRKKQGFVFPFELWVREELKDFIEEKLGILDEKLIKNLLNGFIVIKYIGRKSGAWLF